MRFQLRSLGWLVVAMTIGFCQSPARGDEPFGYFQNDWNVIGLKDYQDGTRITPDNELILAGGDKLQIRFGKDLKPRQPKASQDASRRLDAGHPTFGERRRRCATISPSGPPRCRRSRIGERLMIGRPKGTTISTGLRSKSPTPAPNRPRRNLRAIWPANPSRRSQSGMVARSRSIGRGLRADWLCAQPAG